MKITTFLKWFLFSALLVAFGVGLVIYSIAKDNELSLAYDHYHAAQSALKMKNFKSAYSLYLQSAEEFDDPHLKATALYEASLVGWAGGLADYNSLVGLYQQALRYDPNLYEASFNLEYLYWLKANLPEMLPQPAPGNIPTRKEEESDGDV